MESTREALEARWQALWMKGRELEERQERLLSSLETIEPSLYHRAEEQLLQERQEHERALLELQSQMEELGGFDE